MRCGRLNERTVVMVTKLGHERIEEIDQVLDECERRILQQNAVSGYSVEEGGRPQEECDARAWVWGEVEKRCRQLKELEIGRNQKGQ